MLDERGAEITSDVPIIHYCDRWIVFGRQDAEERANGLSGTLMY